jgi:threonine synthase
MKYFSTNKQSPLVDFRQATITGQAPDKGLYFPEEIPQLSSEFIKDIRSKRKDEIAFEVIRPYVGGTIPDEKLFQICSETIDFPFPLKSINNNISALELFHGPTLAFKDVGARFMSRCLGYFSGESKQLVTVLVATSGDTGSAVANGFLGVEGVNVVILYPSGKVSKIQELQLTTLGRNIRALEVIGTFDDCQRMVKEAFMDTELNSKMSLTSANSINVARWLPQQFYYFYAYQQWQEDMLPVVCVPSGNFGNICAGLLAFRSGLPIEHFIAACNSNDVFTEYIESGVFTPKKAVSTLSNAMDVGDPSNFIRILELFGHSYPSLLQSISSYRVDDTKTAETILEVYRSFGYLLDPHGAVAYSALTSYLESHSGQKGILLETAHPVKFADVEEKIIQQQVEIPESLAYLLKLQKKSELIKPEFKVLKEFLSQVKLTI